MKARTMTFAATLAGAILLAPAIATATEGALGRPITGMQIAPFAGLIPPDPGAQWSVGFIHYDGSIGGSREVPIAGQVSAGLEAGIDLFTATGVYLWPTGAGRWNFASMLTVPYISNDVTADLDVGPQTRRVSQSASDLFDLYFAPVIASYHVNEMEHWSFAAYIYAPTAEYDPTRLANPGLNVWTVSPTVGYTKLMLKGALEFSATAAVDWYSDNPDTHYSNGLVGRAESLLILRGTRGWGVGAAAGWIQQLQDDSGNLADRLDGFQGRALGIGPIVTYSKKWSNGGHADFSLRYISEFSVKNRFEGDPLMISASFGF